MAFAYATSNKFSGLTASAFTFPTGGGPLDATRSYLCDGKMDARYAFTSYGSTDIIQISFSFPQSLCAIAILNHNLAIIGAGVITITAADGVAFGGADNVITVKAATTLNTVSPKQKDSVLQFAAVSKQYWRITIGHGLSSGLAIGELYGVGTSTQLSRGQVDGSGEGLEIITTSTRMLYGQTRALFLAGPIRTKKVRSVDFTTADILELQTLWETVRGPATPFLWIESYETTSTAAATAQQECIFGRITLSNFDWTWTDYLYKQPPEIIIQSESREAGA